MENPTVTGLQNAFKQQAATVSEKSQPTPPTPPQPANENDPKPPENSTLSPEDVELATKLKSRYNLDLSDDEILSRLKPANGNDKPPAPEPNTPPDAAPNSVKRPAKYQKPEEIPDDEVRGFLETNNRKETFDAYLSTKEKQDLALVSEHFFSQIKQEFPDMDDEDMQRLVNERFYIPENDYDSTYTDAEKKLGQSLLKKEAERLRAQTEYPVSTARNMLYQRAIDEQANEAFEEDVRSYIQKVPKTISFQLGKSGAVDLGTFPVQLEQDSVDRIGAIMANPNKLLEKFKDDKGEFSIDLMYNFLMKGELFDVMLKSAATEYYSRGLENLGQRLGNFPDTNGNISRRVKPQTPQEEKAKEFNQKQVADNLGRGRR
jgi:hypothetical protein